MTNAVIVPGIKVSITGGVSDKELDERWTLAMYRLGITVDEEINESTRALICSQAAWDQGSDGEAPAHSKVLFALDFGIPIVTPEWLRRVKEQQKFVEPAGYLHCPSQGLQEY